MEKVRLYDTTLRDGLQAEDVNFSVEDKIRITHFLDEMEFDYIEGGYPGSNPKDESFFKKVSKVKFNHAMVFAFGSTHKADNKVEDDANVKALVKASVPGVTVFGKSWDIHVTEALQIPLERNLELIFDSVRCLKARLDVVFSSDEDSFNGFMADKGRAMEFRK